MLKVLRGGSNLEKSQEWTCVPLLAQVKGITITPLDNPDKITEKLENLDTGDTVVLDIKNWVHQLIALLRHNMTLLNLTS